MQFKTIITIWLFILLASCAKSKFLSNDETLFQELQSIYYFEYSDLNGINKIKAIGIKNLLSSNLLVENCEDIEPSTKRVYHIDGEYLSDWGGIDFFLTKIQPFCKKTGFELKVENHVVNWDKSTSSRQESMTMNGRNYDIFKNESIRNAEGWYIAPVRIANMLNNELFEQGFKERFYLINMENDLYGAFLTNDQYLFYKKNISDIYWQPHTPKDWMDLYQITLKE